MKNPVAFFEVPASDFKKAKEFYETVFDWKVELWGDEGAMALTTAAEKDHNPIEPGGINGGFYKRTSKSDQPSFGVQTGSIDKTLQAIEKAGGTVITSKHAIGEWGSWPTLQILKATSSRSEKRQKITIRGFDVRSSR